MKSNIKNETSQVKIPSFQFQNHIYGLSIQKFNNKFQINNPLIATSTITTNTNSLNIIYINEDNSISQKGEVTNLSFPLSKISFNEIDPQLIATSDINLSLYKIDFLIEDEVEMGLNCNYSTDKFKLDINKIALLSQDEEFNAPITSFDWNKTNKNLIITCSIDNTCSIWDVNSQQVISKLIAHDTEVYDVSFLDGENIFVSVGGDGELRLFDLRDLDNSQIVFDSKDGSGLVRLSVSPYDKNYILTLSNNKPYFYLIDMRELSSPVGIIQSHTNIVNSVQWSDVDKDKFASCGDDKNLFIWDVNSINFNKPIYEYNDFEYEINNIDWKNGILCFNVLNKTKVLSINNMEIYNL